MASLFPTSYEDCHFKQLAELLAFLEALRSIQFPCSEQEEIAASFYASFLAITADWIEEDPARYGKFILRTIKEEVARAEEHIDTPTEDYFHDD